MKENCFLSIVGSKVILVPYRRKFVKRYHEWMKDPYILEMTASEPLQLSEEYEMQVSWKEDPNKCTFIVLSAAALENNSENEIKAMAGDVNLFLNDYEDKGNAEIDVMIAEACYRRQGFAQEAVELLMAFAVKQLNIHRFYAKINQSNTTSRNLFQRLGFVEVNYVAAFEEYEYEFKVDSGKEANTDLLEDDNTTSIDSSANNSRDIILKRASHAKYVDYLEPDGDGTDV